MTDLVRPDEAQEWRGSAARLLVSYPDHPGLLLARAISELTDPTGSLSEASATLTACVQSARARYGIGDDPTAAALSWAADRFVRRGDAAAAAVVAATGRQHLPGWKPPEFGALNAEPAAAVVECEIRLEDAIRVLDSLMSIGEMR